VCLRASLRRPAHTTKSPVSALSEDSSSSHSLLVSTDGMRRSARSAGDMAVSPTSFQILPPMRIEQVRKSTIKKTKNKKKKNNND
jgi:hypothetical protein